MTAANASLIVVCGFAGCNWSMEVDRSSGADPMVVHEAYLVHLDEHDPDCAECEAAEHWVGVAQALLEECPSCHAEPGQPHTEYCKLSRWAEHDAEVARALAEDKIPRAGVILCRDPACVSRAVKHSHPEGWPEHPSYLGGLYAGDTPEQIAAEQARVDRFMEDR